MLKLSYTMKTANEGARPQKPKVEGLISKDGDSNPIIVDQGCWSGTMLSNVCSQSLSKWMPCVPLTGVREMFAAQGCSW